LVGKEDVVVAMWVNQFKELVNSPTTHHSISDRNVPNTTALNELSNVNVKVDRDRATTRRRE
jgi:hypothetical protein